MNGADLLLLFLSALSVFLFLFLGSIFFLFLERFVLARIQHRDGPGRAGRIDFFQVWKDFLKTRVKKENLAAPLPKRFALVLFAWKLLPFIFLLILVGELLPPSLEAAELPALLLLPIIAVALEALAMHGALDANERFEWRKRIVLSLMGASALFLSVFAVALRVGQLSLHSVSEFQSFFPYLSLASSPGLFLCALAAFCSIFLFANESPIQHQTELSLNRSMQYQIFLVRKMWIFCLVVFWVFVFLGGGEGLLAKIFLSLKVAVVLFFLILLQASFPRMRSADAGEFTVRWLLRLCLFGFLLEAAWVGIWQ